MHNIITTANTHCQRLSFSNFYTEIFIQKKSCFGFIPKYLKNDLDYMCEVMQRHLFIFILTETYKVLWGIPNHPTVRVYQKIKNLFAITKHE